MFKGILCLSLFYLLHLGFVTTAVNISNDATTGKMNSSGTEPLNVTEETFATTTSQSSTTTTTTVDGNESEVLSSSSSPPDPLDTTTSLNVVVVNASTSPDPENVTLSNNSHTSTDKNHDEKVDKETTMRANEVYPGSLTSGNNDNGARRVNALFLTGMILNLIVLFACGIYLVSKYSRKRSRSRQGRSDSNDDGFEFELLSSEDTV